MPIEIVGNLTNPFWSKFSEENIQDVIYSFKPTFGQLGHPEHFDISLFNSTHYIKKVTVNEEKDILLDVNFVNNEKCQFAAELIKSKKFRFGCRAVGKPDKIKKIFTWNIIPVENIENILTNNVC